MTTATRNRVTITAILVGIYSVPALLAQSVLSQLGLTETAARNCLINELLSPARARNSEIVLTGNRAFLKLPAAARGPAATAVFAWVKANVDSPGFKAQYAVERRNRLPTPTGEPPVEEAVRKKIAE